jgi:hypothetical protein
MPIDMGQIGQQMAAGGGQMGGMPQMAPPPGAAAQSRGPIGRLSDFLRGSYQADPQRYMMMMAALAGAGTNPQLPLQMAQQFYTGEREREMQGRQIEATRESKEAKRAQQEDYRFRMERERLHRMAQGLNPDEWLPEDQSIDTPEELQEARIRVQSKLGEKAERKSKDKFLSDVLKGAKSRFPEEWTGDEELRGNYDDVIAERDRLKGMKDEYLQMARERHADAKERATKADPKYKSRIQIQLNKIRQLEGTYDRIMSQILSTDLDIWGKMSEYERMLNATAEQIELAYNDVRGMAEGHPATEYAGAGTTGHLEPRDIRAEGVGQQVGREAETGAGEDEMRNLGIALGILDEQGNPIPLAGPE